MQGKSREQVLHQRHGPSSGTTTTTTLLIETGNKWMHFVVILTHDDGYTTAKE
jgi:hypothetical protein